MKHTRLHVPTIVLAVVVLVVGVSGGAMAAKLITGKDIKNGSLTAKDLHNGAVTTKKLKDGAVGTSKLKNGAVGTSKLKNGAVGTGQLKNNSVTTGTIKDGTIGSNDLSSAAKNSLKTTYSGPTWGIVDRNVIGNGDSYLRAGPVSNFAGSPGTHQNVPSGIGSLRLRTGGAGDKAAFGDQVDFQGVDLNTFTKLDYWSFTTKENIQEAPAGVVNLPSLSIEINPNLATHPGDIFASAVFLPDGANNVPGWSEVDAVNSGQWFLTGQTGTDVGCNQTTTCSWSQLLAALDDGDSSPPTIFTVQFTKGRDYAYSGAVDKLTIDNKIYDFEPFGVTVTTS